MSLSVNSIETRKTIRCLIIQLARTGDTIQSLMALRAAKQLYPQLEIYLLVREKFSTAAQRVPWIDGLFTFSSETLLGPVFRGEKTQAEALGDLGRWLNPVIQDPWDLVINWSYSEASSFLTGLIPAKVKLGYSRRRDTSFFGTDGWSHYIQGIVQEKIHQNVHITDILTTQLLTALQIHVGEPTQDGNAPVTSKSFFSLLLQEKDLKKLFSSQNSVPGRQSLISNASTRKWISIQLSTGPKESNWDPRNWARLAAMILEKHPEYTVFLLGTRQDQVNLDSFLDSFKDELPSALANSGRFFSLVGETNFDLWASVISRSQWLLSGNSAAIHLASVLGTRVLYLSSTQTRFHESGPYGNGHYLVIPNEESPAVPGQTHLPQISPETAYATWTFAANEWVYRKQQKMARAPGLEEHFDQLGEFAQLKSVRIFRSRIRNTNDGGGVVYEPLLKHSLHLNDWTASVMGHIARYWYCGWVPPIGSELDRQTISPQLIQKLRELQECSEVMIKICEEASRTSTSLQLRASSLRSERIMGIQARQEIQKLGDKLNDLEILLGQLGKNHFPLTAFANMAKVLLSNLKGCHLSELSRETATSYRQINEGLKIFKDWIQFTLKLAKPIALTRESSL